MILGSALIVTVVSPVFSEEHQTKMSTLLLASRNGREGAAFAKEAAAFTAAALIYAATAAAALSMTGLVYGFRGGSCMSGMVLTPHGLNTALAFTLKPVAWAAFLMLAVDFLALMTLCAMTLCVSAHQKTAFTRRFLRWLPGPLLCCSVFCLAAQAIFWPAGRPCSWL